MTNDFTKSDSVTQRAANLSSQHIATRRYVASDVCVCHVSAAVSGGSEELLSDNTMHLLMF